MGIGCLYVVIYRGEVSINFCGDSEMVNNGLFKCEKCGYGEISIMRDVITKQKVVVKQVGDIFYEEYLEPIGEEYTAYVCGNGDYICNEFGVVITDEKQLKRYLDKLRSEAA